MVDELHTSLFPLGTEERARARVIVRTIEDIRNRWHAGDEAATREACEQAVAALIREYATSRVEAFREATIAPFVDAARRVS